MAGCEAGCPKSPPPNAGVVEPNRFCAGWLAAVAPNVVAPKGDAAGAGAPNAGAGVAACAAVGAPNAGAELAPKSEGAEAAPNAGAGAEDAPNAGVAAGAPNAGVDAAPNVLVPKLKAILVNANYLRLK